MVENILFKSMPAEMMTQSAAECAFKLHSAVKGKLDQIASVEMETQGPAMGIVNKTGPLRNPADRDHCIQYVAAVGLIEGALHAHHFEDEYAADPRIDALRGKMNVVENPSYTKDFYAPSKRSSANAIQVRFKDGSKTARVEVEYPIGHRKRRADGLKMVEAKFVRNVTGLFSARQSERIIDLCLTPQRVETMTVPQFVDLFVV